MYYYLTSLSYDFFRQIMSLAKRPNNLTFFVEFWENILHIKKSNFNFIHFSTHFTIIITYFKLVTCLSLPLL